MGGCGCVCGWVGGWACVGVRACVRVRAHIQREGGRACAHQHTRMFSIPVVGKERSIGVLVPFLRMRGRLLSCVSAYGSVRPIIVVASGGCRGKCAPCGLDERRWFCTQRVYPHLESGTAHDHVCVRTPSIHIALSPLKDKDVMCI